MFLLLTVVVILTVVHFDGRLFVLYWRLMYITTATRRPRVQQADNVGLGMEMDESMNDLVLKMHSLDRLTMQKHRGNPSREMHFRNAVIFEWVKVQ